MKRALLGIMAAGLLLAAPTANAQEGDVIVNGKAIQAPVGCVQVADQPDELSVENNTDKVISVYTDDQCTGDAAAMVDPGETRSVTGWSISAS